MKDRCNPDREGVDCEQCRIACAVLKRTPECKLVDGIKKLDDIFGGCFNGNN